VAINIAHQLYYVDVVDLVLKNSNQLETLSNKAMDVVCKEHMTTFHKRLHVCNLSLGSKFLHEAYHEGAQNWKESLKGKTEFELMYQVEHFKCVLISNI
jgi:hypothetical protein